jgi:pimeloyl-ACP methyl ester carboxylesterase
MSIREDPVTTDTSTTIEPMPVRPSDPPSRHPAAGRSARVAIILLLLLLPLAVAAAVAIELTLAERDVRRHPPPGDRVELVTGHRLHLDVTVRGGGPTVVLESGAGIPSSLWGATVDAVLETVEGPVTVVAYDRAGSAWSGPVLAAPTPKVVVADLREALATQGLSGPYVLVGHSIGGHYVRVFAADHPDEVAGVLLVDPRHEDAAARLPALVEAQDATTRMLRWAVRLRPFGITRLAHKPSDQLPDDLASQLYALELQRDHLRGSLALGEVLDQIDDDVAGHASDLGDIRVRVVSAGYVPDDEPFADELAAVLDELHGAMTALSTDATRHVVADADHLSILTDPTHARELAEQIADLLDTAH